MSQQTNAVQVQLNLLHKYSNSFSFFQSKSINQIIFNVSDCYSNIDYKEAIIEADDKERLRRVYRTMTSYGRPEIQDRMKLLIDFFMNAYVMTYEYPTMIITSCRSIYQRRLRRMRKMVASDASSDYSSENYYGKYNNTFSSEFLKSGSDQESYRAREFFNLNLIGIEQGYFQNEGHSIYDEGSYEFREMTNIKSLQELRQGSENEMETSIIDDLEEQNPQQQKLFQGISEESMSHLFCDFEDLDEDRIEKEYTHLTYKKKNRQNPSTDQQGRQQPKQQKVTILHNHLQKFFKKNENREAMFSNQPVHMPPMKNKKEIIRESFDHEAHPQYWAARLNILPNTQNPYAQNPYAQNPEHPPRYTQGREQQSNYKKNLKQELEIKKEKKQKIRDKATALLNRVKSFDYLNRIQGNGNKEITKDEGSTQAKTKIIQGSNRDKSQ